MEIEISDDILKNIEEASEKLGVKDRELILRAIKFYLHNLREQIEFNSELQAWESAGVQDSINFEKQI